MNMAPPRKRRPVRDEEEMEEEGDSDVNTDEEDENLGKVLQVEFDADAPTADDYDGIQLLLQQKLSKLNINVGNLTELIIKQAEIGCVIKQAESDESDDEDNTILAVFSIINLMHRKGESSIKQLRSLIDGRCKAAAPELHGNVMEILNDDSEHVGFLISERFFGIPPRICVPSFRSLKEDMETLVRANKPFKFKHFLMLCQTLKEENGPELMYRLPEEKLISDVSEITVTWPLQREAVEMNEKAYEQCHTMLIFSASELDNIINKIELDKELLNQV